MSGAGRGAIGTRPDSLGYAVLGGDGTANEGPSAGHEQGHRATQDGAVELQHEEHVQRVFPAGSWLEANSTEPGEAWVHTQHATQKHDAARAAQKRATSRKCGGVSRDFSLCI